MSTVNNNKPVVVPNNPAPIDDTLKPGEVKPPAAPGAAAGAKTLPPDLGGSAGADNVRATPKLPAPNMDLVSDLSTEDLMLFVEEKKEKCSYLFLETSNMRTHICSSVRAHMWED